MPRKQMRDTVIRSYELVVTDDGLFYFRLDCGSHVFSSEYYGNAEDTRVALAIVMMRGTCDCGADIN